MLPGFTLNPVSAILHGIGNALHHAVESLASWTFQQMINALQSTTAIHLNGWFTGPWRAMAAVAALFAVPLLLAGVVHEVWLGNPAGALHRGLLMPLLVGVALLAAPVLLSGLLAIVDEMCVGLEAGALGGSAGYGRALANMQNMLGGVTGDGSALHGLPGPVTILLLLVVAVLAFVIWIELALRAALVYVLAVMIPLAAAGLFWRHTATWTRRVLDVLLAVVLSKLVITAVMVLAAAALGSPASGGTGSSIDQVATGVALLMLGTFALPMTLKVIPHVSEAAVAAGTGALMVSKARSGAQRGGTAVAAAAGPTPVGWAGAAAAGPSVMVGLAAQRRGMTTAAQTGAGSNGAGPRPGRAAGDD